MEADEITEISPFPVRFFQSLELRNVAVLKIALAILISALWAGAAIGADTDTAIRGSQALLQGTLELSLRAEFEACAQAKRERLERLAHDDALGAAIAAKALSGHQARYFEFKGRLARLAGSPQADAAPRSPFAPDFANPRSSSVPSGEHEASPAWDLYAERQPGSPAAPLNKRWSLYNTSSSPAGETTFKSHALPRPQARISCIGRRGRTAPRRHES